ncbi:Non-repetitive/WGA-negative nucleoporin C-terminal-domain-containing protein [Dunaliella salina]|nr:Non-repetitive/WGA-negative nucleoporin C-terminal-domain-containing protein [Dunaliella salina]|eukprot:KAF5829261.1 Non-repetitive/WGA-negative nucleoporin C-terminal-domain-containing protein [Dunaliella salina]
MGGSTPGLREMLTELDNFVPGEACAIASSPQPSALGPEVQTAGAQEELIAQLFLPASRYVLISTAGVVELEKRRPIDILVRVLEERHPNRVRQFFEAYGAPEAAAMCINIASSRPGTYPVDAVREAIAALEEPALVGEPRMPEDALLGGLAGDVGGVRASAANGGLAGGGIYMGQAVNPNPEPNWSSAHRGLCLYLTRLLAPVWDMHITTSAASTKAKGADAGSSVLHCSFSARTMAALIERLHCLDMFLTDFINRRQQQGYSARYSPKQGSSISFGGGYAPSAGGLFGPAYQEEMQNGGMAVAQQAAKRQRLNHAAQLEDERTSRTRALAAKNLRDLVYDSDGETVAAKLISVLITQQLDNAATSAGGAATALGGAVSGVEEVAAMLQKNCPSYFKEDDRAFYQASAKLKAAETAPNASARAALVSDALATLSRVPLACNLEYLVSQLAYLRCYEGIVDVPLRAAAAADPIGAALRPEAAGAHEEAKQRRRAAYQHIFSTLRMLVSGEGNPGAAAGSGPDAQKGLTSQERASFKSALLKAAFKSGDVFFLECLYDAMIAMGDATTLLSSDPPHLERFLAEHSGLATATGFGSSVVYLPNNGAPVGPLNRRQVQLAELLAKFHIGKRRFQEAASVYAALASRRSGPGESAVGLEERVSALQAAVLQAKSVGNSGLVDKLEADARLMSYQAQVAQRLEARRSLLGPESEEEASELGRQASDLATGLRDVSELYNDYAQPYKMWDVCLQLIDFAGSAVDAALVRQLWDHALLAAADHPESAIMGDSTSQQPSMLSPPLGRGIGAGLTARMSAVAALVERLGSQFFPHEASFPATHVAFRMEQVAAGLWPTAHAAATTAADGYKGDAMARAMLGACHNSLPAALRVYELLLARRAPGVPEAELAQVRLKVSLLRSLAHLCRAAQAEVVSALVAPGLATADGLALATGMGQGRAAGPQAALTLAHREAGNLADACERYALEARRLGDAEAEELAGVFDAVKAAAR